MNRSSHIEQYTQTNRNLLFNNHKAFTEDDAKLVLMKHNVRHGKIVRFFLKKIATALKDQINLFVYYLNNRGYRYATDNINAIITHDAVSKIFKELYHKAAFIESNYVLKYLNKGSKGYDDFETKRIHEEVVNIGVGFEELAPIIDGYFGIYLLNNSSIPINDYTKKLIRKYLIEKVEAGENFHDAVTNFNALAIDWTGREGLADKRARRIAITESTRAISFGGLIGAYMSGVDVDKTWVTSNDHRVRGMPNYEAPFPHTSLDLKKTSLMGPFYNGENIKYPGDPTASIENTAYCRCAMFFEKKPKPKPRILRRLSRFLMDFFNGFFVT